MLEPAQPMNCPRSLLMWSLAQERELVGRTLAMAADVPAAGPYERDVDFVSVRPADFPATPDGFGQYVRRFSELLRAARDRTSPTRRACQQAALLPPRLAWHALTLNGRQTAATFGSMGVSILKDTQVFIAPMTDAAFDDGFLAMGSASLPTATGATVAAISIKGEPAAVERLRDAVARMLAKAREGAQSGSVQPEQTS